MSKDSEEPLTRLTCSSCGVVFGFSSALERYRRRDSGIFFCPNGHGQKFVVTSDSKLEAEIATLRVEADALKAELMAVRAERETLKAELEIWKPRAGVA